MGRHMGVCMCMAALNSYTGCALLNGSVSKGCHSHCRDDRFTIHDTFLAGGHKVSLSKIIKYIPVVF